MPSGQLDYFLLDKIRLLLGKQIVQKQCVWRFARDGQFFEALCHSIVGSLLGILYFEMGDLRTHCFLIECVNLVVLL